MKLPAFTFLVSFLLHASVLLIIPHYLSRSDKPLLTTVVVELLDKTPGEPESTLQSSPAGDRAKAAGANEPGERSKAVAKDRLADAGRAAENTGALPPKRPPLKKSEPLDVENLPKTVEKKPSQLPSPPDPAVGKALEATVRLDEADRRYKGFLDGVRSAVDSQWNSRDAMIEAQRSGTVTLGFTIVSGGGRASKAEVLGSSQSAALDNEALRAVRAANFPSFPKGWKLERLHLVGQFDYAFSSGD